MTLEQLQARLKELADTHSKLSAKFDTLTDEEQTQLQAVSDEFDVATKKIEVLERSVAMSASLQSSAGRLAPAVAPSGPRITGGDPVVASDPKCGYRDIAEFAHDVVAASAPHGQGRMSDRLRMMIGIDKNGGLQSSAATTYGSEGVGADGGFAVPPEFRSEIWSAVYETGSIMSAAGLVPTTQSAVVEAVSEWTPWGASGVQGYWVGEGAAITQSKPSLRQVTTNLHKVAALVPATEELVEDAPRLMELLTQQAPACIRYMIDDAIVNGDGVAKPLGVMNATSLISQAKETSQTAATVVAANLAKMWGRLLPGGHMRAIWIVSPDVYQQLITMTLGSFPAFMPANQSIQGAPSGTIFGRPIIVSHVAQTAGTAGDVILADFDGYIGYMRGGLKFTQSLHLFFDYDEQAFKWTFRVGGQPRLSAAISPDKGSTTIGHFITIATRS